MGYGSTQRSVAGDGLRTKSTSSARSSPHPSPPSVQGPERGSCFSPLFGLLETLDTSMYVSHTVRPSPRSVEQTVNAGRPVL